jgi:hypothetical protein
MGGKETGALARSSPQVYLGEGWWGGFHLPAKGGVFVDVRMGLSTEREDGL